jgi:hypothetical protein
MSQIFLFDDPALDRRGQRWIDISVAQNFRRLEGGGNTYFFLQTIQRIGRLDCNLIHEDNRINPLSSAERNEREELITGYDHDTLAILWVIGAFGLIYSIEKMMHRNKVKFTGLHNRIAALNRKLNRLRTTFAKGDPQQGDYLHPHQAMRFKGSTCWGVNPTTYISRIELSDELLELLDAIAKHSG